MIKVEGKFLGDLVLKEGREVLWLREDLKIMGNFFVFCR